MEKKQILAKNVNLLAEISQQEKTMKTEGGKQPSVIVIERIIELLKQIIFPGYFGAEIRSRESRLYHVGVSMEALEKDLKEQICLSFRSFKGEDVKEETSDEIALKFIDTLPEIKRVLYTDIEAMSNADPAVTAYGEIIFCYPIVQVMLHYRVAHALLRLGVPVLPRIITEMAHSKTGIDIHPGAQIGEYFSIDHGTGVVIGETCIIGNHVTLYQGVTLGAKKFTYNENGTPVNTPRHPIIEDNVTIYSNSSILGRITIGHDTIVGGNIWLTESVRPYSKIVQQKAVSEAFIDGAGI
ncbi:MAG: serine acetyltransferase [Bacteroidales bacterium]|jgi:serine O-acetyltransferase|nr:serine acetyltransferase [Bacteroidales bacterium]MEE3448223.1 serine acetyltransferase [Bacteroidales bacterium]